MERRRLPIGIQNFREMREGGHYYVDKTDYARRLAEDGKHYFLSRPRRFGKSLFLDTLKELFAGDEALFRGLTVHDTWDWSVRHPVVRLSFGGGSFRGPDDLAQETAAKLEELEIEAGVESTRGTPAARLRRLIRTLHRRSGRRVVVLVDEYDKPILDVFSTPDQARANRDFLRALYGTVKDCDAHVRFSFFTGVSKFTKVSVFSELNNLIDLTLDPAFAAICGYTEADLETVFGPELPGLDRDRIRDWYNGYHWLGESRVYNPHDLLLLFRLRAFDVHWFETATPSFLIEALGERMLFTPALDGMFGTRELLSSFDVEGIAPEALLFQTGYLTITGQDTDAGGRPIYRLGYPNREVRQSLNEYLLRELTPGESQRAAPPTRLPALLAANDFAGVEKLFRSFFASIPYEWHTKSPVARYEGYYASVFYSYCAASGLPVAAEESTSRGRVDLTIHWKNQIFLFEFKVSARGVPKTATTQLRERGYADRYRHLGQPIHLLGVEFSSEARNVASFTAEPA